MKRIQILLSQGQQRLVNGNYSHFYGNNSHFAGLAALGIFLGALIRKLGDFFQAPNMIRHTSLHRWRDSQGLMDTG